MKFLPNAPAPRRACEVRIQIPEGATPPAFSPAHYARAIHPVPLYIGAQRIMPAADDGIGSEANSVGEASFRSNLEHAFRGEPPHELPS